VVQTETDVIGLGTFADRQPDFNRFRLWEIPGTGHADAYTLFIGSRDPLGSVAAARVVEEAEPIPGIISCDSPVNGNPAHHFVFNAAVRAMDEWVRCGTLPPVADRMDLDEGPPRRFVLDSVGNAMGGIRTPYLDAPTAIHSGGGQAGFVCGLFGSTTLLDESQLRAMYFTRDTYRYLVDLSLDAAVEDGFILPEDAGFIRGAAEALDVWP